jgi:hydantoinase/carbamoylase family amidase
MDGLLMHVVANSEEGARFPKSMTSSGVWAGNISLQEAWDLRDIHNPNITLKSELERHGYLGEIACSYDAVSRYPLGAHFELHIEQGPILEQTQRSIGVVQGSQAYRWLSFSVSGRDAHTGTTPLSARRDPLLAASRMIASSNEIAQRHGALASTGILKIPSNASTNTIASEVTFTLDIRHPDDSVVDIVQAECLESFNKIAAQDGKGVSFTWQIDTDSAAVRFDKNCIDAVRAAAHNLVGPGKYMDITSGAGHDSVYTSRRCPTTMIFVPCRDGVSHHPEEYCSPEDWYVVSHRMWCWSGLTCACSAIGTQALLEAVVYYDRFRMKQEGES